jgi:AhpD family alkylhydroperoxidase
MDENMKELIAIGASVSAHCQPCVTYHVGKARELGIGEEDIRAAVAVGQQVEKGAGAAMREFAEKVVGGGEPAVRTPPCCSGGAVKNGGC